MNWTFFTIRVHVYAANVTTPSSDGQKMSKRKKNYPYPEIIINEDSADALRLAFVI